MCGPRTHKRECGETFHSRTVSTKPVANPPFKKVICALRHNDPSIVQADKEGGFVILPDGDFREKALGAIQKNFKTVAFDPKKQKYKALKLLAGLNLDSLRKATSKEEAGLLDLFFTLKTHKPECPFRVIVSEKSTWQSQVGHYLQRQLQQLRLDDAFLVRSSTEVTQKLEEGPLSGVYAFSLDVEDLYYNIPHDELFSVLRQKN